MKIEAPKNKIFGLDDEFDFGAHKGEQVEDVIVDNPGYISWCCRNDICEFDNEALEAITRKGIV